MIKKDLKKFSTPEAEIIELPDIDTIGVSSGEIPEDEDE